MARLRKASFSYSIMRHSANLDFLRSFAVSLVLSDHLILTLTSHVGFQNNSLHAWAVHLGKVGVLAFFVHTSLVLMYSLERMTRSTDRVSIRFYVRSLFRIYPLSIFAITLVLVLHIPDNTWGSKHNITPSVILSDLLLVQNLFTKTSVLSPLWSLPYEVQMYLVLPALYYLAIRRRGVLYLCALLVFFCALGFLIAKESGGHLNMAAYVPCFLSGVICYSLRDRIRARLPAALWPTFLFLLVASYCIADINEEPSFWMGWIFCIFLGFTINAFHDSTNKPLNAVAEKVALYSYGVYLLHVPVLYLVFTVFGIKNLVFGPLLFLMLTMVASIITYHFIESPFINLGRRLSSSPVRTPVSPPAQERQEGS